MRSLLLVATLLIGLSPVLSAQTSGPVNVNDMVLEVMRTDIGKDKEGMAMWLPQEFFLAAGMAQSPGLDSGSLAKDLDFLQDYSVFMVQAKTKGEDGPRSLSTAQLRASTSLVDEAGRAVKPLSDLPPKVENLLNLVRQSFASRGNEDFRLLVFPGRTGADKRVFASPLRKGSLTLKVGKVDEFSGMTMTWKTPLASCVKPRPCAKCGETFQAAWSYCAWCGQAGGAK
ncbi:hypothetical protein GETHLI_14560 [Geothrix limicola]|uniref:Uncharacterized protein n=1 Tax=Geothrix limicola TaxID=2927978 RepID=A0ABQ5QDN3_9BACT|nr:zinc ribbon domain-containing protein [Geothrix limicola]GLH72954.1 hypothetical protein GETHLI_14560 [Geothrix limicola]